MIYAIMLDDFQDPARPDEYRVSVSGSLDDCRRARVLPDRYDTWWRADYSSCERLEDHELGGLSGAIFRLETRSGLMAQDVGHRHLPVAAMAGGTFLAGVVVGVILKEPVTNWVRREVE